MPATARKRKSTGLRIDRTLGPLVKAWIEAELVHGPGDVQGQPVELDDEFTLFLLRAYEIDDRGRRKIDRAVFSRPKGRAKSELLAFVACAEALGPVRFAGWGSQGRPLGRAVRSPLIRLAATEEGQADQIYAAVEFMLREGRVSRLRGLDVGQTRTFLPGGGKILPITAKASSKDGGKETFAGFDETHLYVSPELVKLHAVIRRNLAKRKTAEPWSMETTTMFAPGEGSVAEASFRYWQAITDGAVRDPRLLFDHRQAPEDIDYADDDQLRAALIDVYGDAAGWIDIERLVAEARDPQTSEPDYRRYFLNQPTVRENAWIARPDWDARADRTRTVADGAEVMLGFDGSYNDDSTALVGCTVEETPHLFVLGAWEKPDGPAGSNWVVPRHEVDARVHEAMSRYRVLELCADPPQWEREIDGWADRYGDVVVAEFRTNLRRFMGRACAKLHSAVMNDRVTHDGDEALARHVANAVTKETSDGAYITKDGRNSPRKIDLAIAAVIAYDRATTRQEAAESVYQRRDLELVDDVDEPRDDLTEQEREDRYWKRVTDDSAYEWPQAAIDEEDDEW